MIPMAPKNLITNEEKNHIPNEMQLLLMKNFPPVQIQLERPLCEENSIKGSSTVQAQLNNKEIIKY